MLPKAHPDDGGHNIGGCLGGGDDPFMAGLENGFDEAALLDNLMDCGDDDDDCEDDVEGEDESDEDGSDDILYRCDLCSQRFQLLDFLKHQGPDSIEYQQTLQPTCLQSLYRVVQKNSCMFEFPRPLSAH